MRLGDGDLGDRDRVRDGECEAERGVTERRGDTDCTERGRLDDRMGEGSRERLRVRERAGDGDREGIFSSRA